jgi:hypothetical protein
MFQRASATLVAEGLNGGYVDEGSVSPERRATTVTELGGAHKVKEFAKKNATALRVTVTAGLRWAISSRLQSQVGCVVPKIPR